MKSITLPVKNLFVLLFASGMLFLSHSQTLTGKVIDESGTAVKGALVQLANAGRSDTSKTDGTWSISVPSGIEPFVRKLLLPAPVLKGTAVYFAVNENDLPVKAGVYAVSGRLVYNAMDRNLAPGFYTIGPLGAALPPGFYLLRFQMGPDIHCFKLLVANRQSFASGVSVLNTSAGGTTGTLAKMAVVIDTVKVSKAGYVPAAVTIGSYGDGPLTITLKLYAPSYYLNPPNPCYNQFYVQSCVSGDAKTPCSGHCTVANSCSPPEDPSKSNLPKTFICPRFMLYSTEMMQAAKDDAALYGWGSGDPPFTYGVAGHDADVGGLDKLSSSCCQCYQIVFVTPEQSSPQPPNLPCPKPLIVQSFNTAAGGPKGFDIFMAAGGYGAFNSCYNDASFGNTTKFNEFMYDSFPYQNPGSGGISFLRFPECIKGWPPTADGVLSAACQDKIKQMCNQALMKASSQITDDTRKSCIMCNQLTSLYHQNWQITVKRVRCPQNLTRVTGCRLVEDALPLPLPKVQTPADAQANGTFSSGYNTTTMQDCCKPTCAWADWTVGYKLPVDGDWNSFYSCDKNGTPFTK